jgi:hypothetical protein
VAGAGAGAAAARPRGRRSAHVSSMGEEADEVGRRSRRGRWARCVNRRAGEEAPLHPPAAGKKRG